MWTWAMFMCLTPLEGVLEGIHPLIFGPRQAKILSFTDDGPRCLRLRDDEGIPQGGWLAVTVLQ